MSLRSWAGFLPQKTVVMVRRAGRPSAAVSVDSPYSVESAESVVPVASIAASLKQSLLQGVRPAEQRATPVSAGVSSGVSPASTCSARVLVYVEGELTVQDREFLLKMMSAIELSEQDLSIEWGDFPEAKALVAVGIGLQPRKSGRLSALRPDRFELPSLDAIRTDAAVKRAAWGTLKSLAARLTELQ